MKEKACRVKISRGPLPGNRLISNAFPQVDYWDAHRAELPEGLQPEVGTFARAFVASYPGWKVLRLEGH